MTLSRKSAKAQRYPVTSAVEPIVRFIPPRVASFLCVFAPLCAPFIVTMETVCASGVVKPVCSRLEGESLLTVPPLNRSARQSSWIRRGCRSNRRCCSPRPRWSPADCWRRILRSVGCTTSPAPESNRRRRPGQTSPRAPDLKLFASLRDLRPSVSEDRLA